LGTETGSGEGRRETGRGGAHGHTGAFADAAHAACAAGSHHVVPLVRHAPAALPRQHLDSAKCCTHRALCVRYATQRHHKWRDRTAPPRARHLSGRGEHETRSTLHEPVQAKGTHTHVVPVETPLPMAPRSPLPLNPVAVPKIHPMTHGPMKPLTVAPSTCVRRPRRIPA